MSIRISGSLLGAAFAITVTAAPAADGGQYTGNELFPACRRFVDEKLNRDTVFLGAVCAGIVSGTSYMGNLTETGLTCLNIPDGVTLGQEVRVVVSYIEAHPAKMHESFRKLALEALRTAWPCK
jgi:hypothetical protein